MFVLISSRNFKKECPSGILDKGKVHKIYKQKLLPHSDSKFLVDQLFRIIDDDNNGGIDFRVSQRTLPSDWALLVLTQEFLLAVDMAVSGSLEEKLRWMFRCFFIRLIPDNPDIRYLIILIVIFDRLYDEDDSGVIDLEEMNKISTYLYHIDGVSEVKTDGSHC